MSDGIDPTLVALAKWQGETDRGMQENHRRLEKLSSSVDGVKKQLGEFSAELAGIKASIKLWSTIGAMIGAGVVTYVTGKLG